MLVGRVAELAAAVAVLDSGRSLVVTGEAGAGKTALVSQALEETAIPVLAGQCFRSLAWRAALPLQQAIGRLLPLGDPVWTAQWLAQWLTQSGQRSFLRVDDLQWADPLTLAVVSLLPASTPFVATVRLGDPGTDAALDALQKSGAHVLEVGPLTADAGTELAMRAHPRLRPAEALTLAERCGGNPLLIQELGADREPSAGLRRSVTGRLRRVGSDAWRGFALLSLADEPLPEAWLPEASTLVGAGFAVLTGGMVHPRHRLLAEVVAAELAEAPAEERISLQLDLARRAELGGDLALAARGFCAAGEREKALRFALLAADQTVRPGERASLLHLAAGCAEASEAADLATQAVEELVVAGDYTSADTLLQRLPDLVGAHWSGLVGRVRWQLGDDAGALTAFEAGLAVAQPGTRDAVLLQAEHARAVLLGEGDAVRGLELARAAVEQAEALGLERARAYAVLGTAEHFSGMDGSQHLAQAMELAARDNDLMVEFTSANNLIAVYESDGRPAEARELAERFASRAEQLHMRQWQQQMRAMGLNVAMHHGDYDPIVTEIPPLLAGALDRRTRDQLEVTLSLTLVDLGRHEAALEHLNAALEACVDDHVGRGNLLWVRAEAHLWAGDPSAARDDCLTALADTPLAGPSLFPILTLAHARLQLGEPLEAQDWPAPHVPLLAGAPHELDGLVAQANGDLAAAALSFTRAASAWAGHHRRGELRCRWLAADVDSDPDSARRNLLALEQELADAGLAPLLRRVQRSLRSRGVRSATSRGRIGDLTPREREVLDLVAEGLSTEAIAARLGLTRHTVASHIVSARARLGVNTRWQAANG